MPRLPQPGADDNTWGEILNEFLSVAHNADGSIKVSAVPVASGGVTSVVGQTGDVTGAQIVADDTVAATLASIRVMQLIIGG